MANCLLVKTQDKRRFLVNEKCLTLTCKYEYLVEQVPVLLVVSNRTTWSNVSFPYVFINY